MMCEPLRGKIDQIGYIPAFTIEDVKSAVEFYKKYVDKYGKFCSEQPELIIKFKKEYEDFEDTENIGLFIVFNHWLLRYCFRDVIDDVEKTEE